MKKFGAAIIAFILCVTMCACKSNSAGGGGNSIDPAEYETDGKFITVADLPPNPLSESALGQYKELGLNTVLLTEDNVTFTQNGKITDNYKQAIRNIGASGMDVWIRNMYNDEDYFVNTGANAERERSNYGTPYTMEERNITSEFDEFPQITGYFMSDEPFMTTDMPQTVYGKQYAAMDRYGKLVEWKNTYAPAAFWHMNMVPSKSLDHYLGHTYKEFIEYYVNNIVKNVAAGCGRSVCLDNYPFSDLSPDHISDSYLVDIMTAATVTRDYNQTAPEGKKATFGICLQTFKNTSPTEKLRYPQSSADVTFQMYTGMATGARLFEYFCYNSLSAFGVYGLVDGLTPTQAYAFVKEANRQALGMEKVLCGFDWYNLVTCAGADDSEPENDVAFTGVASMLKPEKGVLKSVTARRDAIVGCFKQGETDGYMAVNFSAPSKKLSNQMKFDFGDCTSAIVYRNGAAKVEKLLSGKYQTTLAAGEGIFVIPVK
ncbi:MAG: hypothetical protein HFE36_01905 [Clostridia bacterium]|nr:hypothetical protein [Clostridia bacterium]